MKKKTDLGILNISVIEDKNIMFCIHFGMKRFYACFCKPIEIERAGERDNIE